jgi:hypothetical protein
VIASICDTSSNGTFVNDTRLERSVPHALRSEGAPRKPKLSSWLLTLSACLYRSSKDVICFATPDQTNDKCIAFKLCKYDRAVHGPPPTETPSKRPRDERCRDSPAAAALVAAHLHDTNQNLRGGAVMAAGALTVRACILVRKRTLTFLQAVQARLAIMEAAAAEQARLATAPVPPLLTRLLQRAEADAQLERERLAAARAREEAAAAAERERSRLEAAVSEASRDALAQRNRADAALAELAEAEAAATAARQERDAAGLQLQEARASAEAAEMRLREAARSDREAAAAAVADLKRVEAELEAERREAGAGSSCVARIEAELAALKAELSLEREARHTTNAALVTALEKAAATEASLARATEDLRGSREGAALDMVLGSRLLDFWAQVGAAAEAVAPHVNALQQRVATIRAELQPVAATQLVGHAVQLAVPTALLHGMTQCVPSLLSSRTCSRCFSLSLSRGMDGVSAPADHGEAALMEASTYEETFCGTIPTASLQAQLELEARAGGDADHMRV